MPVSHHIGLEIAERCFRLVELQQQDRHTAVLRAEVHASTHDYASQLLFDLPWQRELAATFIRDLASVLTAQPLSADTVSLVLPASLPLVTTVAIDADSPATMQRALMEWECQALAAPVGNDALVTLTHTLAPDNRHARSLVVALPNAVIEFLGSTFEHLTLNLTNLDVNHFVVENGVRKLYPHDSGDCFAVLGIHSGHVSAGVYRGGTYQGFRISELSWKQQYAAQACTVLERVAGEWLAELKHVYCFGEHCGNAVVEGLERLLPARVTRFIPLVGDSISYGPYDAHTADSDVLLCSAAAAVLGLP